MPKHSEDALRRDVPWFGRLPEPIRVGICKALKPFVFPVWRFVDRWYYTEPRMRLARVAGTAMWWHLLGDEKPREGDPQTAEEVIDKLYAYADRSKPLEGWRG